MYVYTLCIYDDMYLIIINVVGRLKNVILFPYHIMVFIVLIVSAI